MKNKLNFSYCFLMVILFLSCGKSKNKELLEMDELLKLYKKDLILKSESYYLMQMFNFYVNNDKSIYELLPYAIYVAETDDYIFSYQLIYLATLNKYVDYKTIDSKNHIDYFDQLTEKDKILVLNYLAKGAENNDPVCLGYIIDIYSKQNDQKMVEYFSSKEKIYNHIRIVN